MSFTGTLIGLSGFATVAATPWAGTMAFKVPFESLKMANAAAYGLNAIAATVPGRIDGIKREKSSQSSITPNTREYQNVYSPSRGRSLVSPAAWAFSIWGPIFLGEAVFAASHFFFPHVKITNLLPQVTAPYVAANICQSLWCAAFRPSFQGWSSYVSAALLAGTAFSLSQVHAVTSHAHLVGGDWWMVLPLSMHFGWACAAALVNLSGSVAMNPKAKDSTIKWVGYAATSVATALGVYVPLVRHESVFGWTMTWALMACADGMKQRVESIQQVGDKSMSSELFQAAKNQRQLCRAGAVLCAVASIATFILH